MINKLKQTTIAAVHAFLAEISCQREQSQVYLNYAERS